MDIIKWGSYFLSVLLMLPISISGYNAPPKTEQLFQWCISYTNNQVYQLSNLQVQLDAFDLELNTYYEEFSTYHHARLYQEKMKGKGLIFNYQSILLESMSMYMSKEELLGKIYARIGQLSSMEKKSLTDHFSVMNKLVEELDQYCKELSHHITSKAYLTDPDLSVARGYLSKCQFLLEDFNATKEKLYFDISAIHSKHGLRGRGNGYLPLIHAGNSLVVEGNHLISAIKKHNNQELIEHVAKFTERLLRARQLASTSELFPNDKTERIFMELVAKSDTMLAYIQNYQQVPFSGEIERMNEKDYYYINHYLYPVFSNSESGMVDLYNELVKNSNSGRLPMMNEMKWFVPRDYEPIAPVPDPENYVFEEEVAPVHLVLLVDISGSMNRKDKLPLMQQSCKQLLNYLRKEDRLSIVTFAGKAEIITADRAVSETNDLISEISQLKCEGESKVEEGIILAYKQGKNTENVDSNLRLVMVTDGGFDINNKLLRLIEGQSYAQVPLSVLYVGSEHDEMEHRLKRLASIGGGNFGHAKETLFVPYLLLEAGARMVK